MTRTEIDLPDADASRAFGAAIAAALRPGDTLLLAGELGTGKTHLARAIIQTRLAAAGLAEDVPSPTFTLVQTYDDGTGEIWHADLYRLGGPADLAELGLEDAFDTAICLIEWPDRLGPLRPPDAVTLTLAYAGDGRRLTVDLPDTAPAHLRAAMCG